MNLQQYVLIKLAEELSEAAKEALKAAQFGLDSYNPRTGVSNYDALNQELNDVLAIQDLLPQVGFEMEELPEHQAKKKRNTKKAFAQTIDFGLADPENLKI